jgi:hypothetical protein
MGYKGIDEIETKKPLQRVAKAVFLFVGGPDGARTRDPLRDRQVF